MAKKDKTLQIRQREKIMAELCKKRGWDINELTTGQLLFIINQPEIKNLNKTL
jgi:hypothetical protein